MRRPHPDAADDTAATETGAPPCRPLSTIAGRLVEFAERWFPDAYVFVLVSALVVAGATMLHGGSPLATSQAFGDGFWNLMPFTMQMAMVAIGGFIVATAPQARRALKSLAAIPRSGRGAIVMVGLLSIGLSLANWGLSLIFCGLLVREIARREDLRLDYRAAGAAGYLGLGCSFTLGITSSAAQLQANAASIPPDLLPITGVIDFSQTILTWQNGVVILLVTALSAAICYATAPGERAIRTARDLGISLDDEPKASDGPGRPGDRLEHSPVLSILVVLLALGWLWNTFGSGNPLMHLSGLNTYNFAFLMLGILLHWRPRNLVDAFSAAVPGVSGVLLQFPFYAGIAHMLTRVPNANGMTLSDTIAHWFVDASVNTTVFSLLVGAYSAVLGFFIPSAGGKWIVEAPYVMTAANQISAHLGWTVMVYNIAETLPNLINPFWMLPLLGILRLKPKDIIGYTSIQFFVHLPVVLLVAALLMSTFAYHPPVHPG
ncbi:MULTISPECIES: TIGR00366 family protein [unclassified Chelatococcus]|uniref:short-chain fatty acid transporter n=1 Tax=unclassified Chelatococcus TaxID=2638111 RepID=UPI001BD13416|nr:TIGR00366 family protein [Chelatococcus sp.]MBS7701559.1 short-chain fatty acid transporter [Chelatococcus sp. YT9]MBX3557394.1 short-chain fatty acid transporter [Chelatococcus sp.]